jgi:hypothetical protein
VVAKKARFLGRLVSTTSLTKAVSEIKGWYTETTPTVQCRIVGRRSQEHPKPNLPVAKWKAREGPPRSLPSLVCRLQPRPAFARETGFS